MAQPVTEVGERVARLLNRIIEGSAGTEEHLVLPTELVVRESCGAGPAVAP